MMSGVGIIDRPDTADLVSFKDHDVMPANSDHARRREGSREMKPIRSEPENPDRLTKYPNRGAAAAELDRWTAGGV